MGKKYITTGAGLPKWANPISHAVVANNMCFVSGQLAVNENGEYVAGTIEEETEMAFANFFAALANAGFSKSEVTFVDIAFDNLNDLAVVNSIFINIFPEGKRPARTIYEAAALPFGGKVKVTGTAVRDL